MLKTYIGLVSLLMSLSSIASTYEKYGPIFYETTETGKAGRYLYLGAVPKVDSKDVELTVSKMSLTLRAKVWIKSELMNNFNGILENRLKKISTGLSSPKLDVFPIVDVDSYAMDENENLAALLETLGQYMDHVLSPYPGVMKASYKLDRDNNSSYKQNMIATIKDYYFPSMSMSSESNFMRLHREIFTQDNSKEGYEGFLTLVYPVSAGVVGANLASLAPREQSTGLKLTGSQESRWYSKVWDDAFAGFPFLLYQWNGIAFHGPITSKGSNLWYVKRDYVSHGCMRMDPSDVMELRTILPKDFTKSKNDIRVDVVDTFDVTDWDNDGELEVMDVAYYNLPKGNSGLYPERNKTMQDALDKYSIETQSVTYWQTHKFAKRHYNSETHAMKNVKKYVRTADGSLKKRWSSYRKEHQLLSDGTYEGEIKIHSFKMRKNRIIQYREVGVKKRGFNDRAGQFPPGYFQ